MVGQTLGHYRIEAKLGEGGMGVVYKAEDFKLKRRVALKVLSDKLSQEPQALARLEREAQAASALNHPHICTIHEVGEAAGRAYIVMEYVDGLTLRAMVAIGGVSVEAAVRYGTQIADALAHAHERGVVHRDLKSANVVITPEGQSKVLDFGLAKRVEPSELGEATRSQATLSEEGTIAGTLPYMAPEVLRGERADARSDLWALGVVLHEMAAGQLPFHGSSGFALTSAILRDAPQPLPPHVPAGLRAVISRLLAKEPGLRYHSAGEAHAALEALGQTLPPSRLVVPRRALVSVGALLVVLFAVALAFYLRRAAQPRIESLAVLPLANLSGDTAQDYFADGMTEALITELSKIGGLKKVVSRTSSMQYKGVKKPLREIANELGVDGVVEGSVLREGNQVRITIQLIHGPSDKHVWAQNFDRELRGILALQSEVARAIAREVKVNLSPREQVLLARGRPVNPEAYEAYLKGRFHWYKLSPEGFDTALEYFQLALEKDPNYALAYAGIGHVWGARGYWGLIPPTEAHTKGRAAILKAVELDDSLAEAHAHLGQSRFFGDWDWPAAEREFQRAIELNPNYGDACMSYSHFLVAMRRSPEAWAKGERCLDLDPRNSAFQVSFGWVLLFSRRYDDAIAQLHQALRTNPDFLGAHEKLWAAFAQKRRYEEALAEAKKFRALRGQTEVAEALARGYAEAGYPGAMRRAAESLAARSKLTYVQPTELARLYAHAGQKDRALEWLGKAYEERDSILVYLQADPDWDSLRDAPRFQDLLRRMNFPPTR